MKVTTLLLAFALISGFAVAQQRSTPFRTGAIIDLSYSFDSSTVYWPTAESFHLEKDFEGITEKGYYYSAYRYAAAEHGGTHIDAPVHFARGHWTVDQIPVEQLVGQGVVIDVSRQCAENRDYLITSQDFESWEKRNGRIPRGAIVLLRTGFGRYYPDRKKYMGTDERGAAAVANLHFPGLHPDAAKWITGHRSIKAIGLDTPS
ncbi:MAG TPA: cyclase family protein, partial [Pyrinomonadaceae bacterium]